MTYINEFEEQVKEEWIDYNGHMNVAFYVLVFDHGTDDVLERLGLGEKYREEQNKSVFVVESHITYEQEVGLNDPLVVKSRLVGYDDKRIHIFHEMYHKETNEKCATNEIMALHIDMNVRKTAALSEEVKAGLQPILEESLTDGWPKGCSRAIKKIS